MGKGIEIVGIDQIVVGQGQQNLFLGELVNVDLGVWKLKFEGVKVVGNGLQDLPYALGKCLALLGVEDALNALKIGTRSPIDQRHTLHS